MYTGLSEEIFHSTSIATQFSTNLIHYRKEYFGDEDEKKDHELHNKLYGFLSDVSVLAGVSVGSYATL